MSVVSDKLADFPHLSETHVAVETMNRHLLLAALGNLVVTIGLAIYLSTHRKMEVTDVAEANEP